MATSTYKEFSKVWHDVRKLPGELQKLAVAHITGAVSGFSTACDWYKAQAAQADDKKGVKKA